MRQKNHELTKEERKARELAAYGFTREIYIHAILMVHKGYKSQKVLGILEDINEQIEILELLYEDFQKSKSPDLIVDPRLRRDKTK